MPDHTRPTIDAIALDFVTADAAERAALWLMFEQSVVAELRRAHPDADPATLAALFVDACRAVEKRIGELESSDGK